MENDRGVIQQDPTTLRLTLDTSRRYFEFLLQDFLDFITQCFKRSDTWPAADHKIIGEGI